MIRKISTVFLLLIISVAFPMDDYFFSRILQPAPAFAQSTLKLEDFALYSQKEIKLKHIGESRGNVGSNGSIDIQKGVNGSVIGSFQVIDCLKNEADIGIYGDVSARVIKDRGSLGSLKNNFTFSCH